jgi:hypothetical protein
MSHSEENGQQVVNRAICVAYWPNQDSPVCTAHLIKMQSLAAIMGFALRTSPLLEPDVDMACANCENEAKKKQ